MRVYDIIREVKPGSPCSYQPGRHLARCGLATLDQADQLAERFRECNGLPTWLTYTVECHDESCPGRLESGHEELGCLCKGGELNGREFRHLIPQS